MKFPVKMWLMIMLKIAKSWFLPLSRKHIFRKITWWGGRGQIDSPSLFKVKFFVVQKMFQVFK